jgi:hypothetical protein
MNQIVVNSVVGKLLMLLMGMYGIHIYGQIILFESKGFLPSAFVAMWLLLFAVVALNTTARQLISQSLGHWHKFVIVLFLVYYLVSTLFYSDYAFGYHFSNIIIVVVPGFMLGVASNVNYSNLMPFQRLVRILNTNLFAKRLYLFTGVFSLLFIAYQGYLFYVNKLELTLALVTVDNEYYQDLGDYFVIFYCGWLALRENYRNRRKESERGYVLFTFLLILELAISVIFLQLIGSNKAPLTIVLIGLTYLVFSIPASFRLQLRQFSTIFVLFVLAGFFFKFYVDPELLSSLRFFGEINSGGIASNSSVTSRLDQVVKEGFDQLNRNWVFGDLTIDQYIHSSLISIQTHLGLLGSILFWLFIAMQSYFIYFKGKDRIAKAITLPVVFVSIISSAFWWFPLWFVIGHIYMRKSF